MQLCFHEHSLYLVSENEYPYVAGQVPPIMDPSYVINHFSDINCPINLILKKKCARGTDPQLPRRYDRRRNKRGQTSLSGACTRDSDTNDKLLSLYLFNFTVNGTPCRMLRDRRATIDLVHPDYVTPADYNGKCAWV